MSDASGFFMCGVLIFLSFALHRIADAIYYHAEKMNYISSAIGRLKKQDKQKEGEVGWLTGRE